jgi:hypothetical protein
VLGEWTDFVLETTWHCVKEIDMLYLEYRGKTTDKVAGRQSNWGIRRLNWVERRSRNFEPCLLP